jgi:hypothetical protein
MERRGGYNPSTLMPKINKTEMINQVFLINTSKNKKGHKKLETCKTI